MPTACMNNTFSFIANLYLNRALWLTQNTKLLPPDTFTHSSLHIRPAPDTAYAIPKKYCTHYLRICSKNHSR